MISLHLLASALLAASAQAATGYIDLSASGGVPDGSEQASTSIVDLPAELYPRILQRLLVFSTEYPTDPPIPPTPRPLSLGTSSKAPVSTCSEREALRSQLLVGLRGTSRTTNSGSSRPSKTTLTRWPTGSRPLSCCR